MKTTRTIIGFIALAMMLIAGCSQQNDAPAQKTGNAATQPASPQPPASAPEGPDYLRAAYDPIHFRPAIETAKDEQCLSCHKEVLEDRVRETSPAGVKASESKAWYQRLDTYQGDQETFHRRHLVMPYAKQVMDLKCNTCHQGHDPREKAPESSATTQKDGYTLRKDVDPNTCLLCHGKMNFPVMGLIGDWSESHEMYADSCVMACHGVAFRTNRHQVNYLKPEAIEAAAEKDSYVCYGCHGGRAWYRINYPYPRHPWPNMDPNEPTPDWAKDRPTTSEARFLRKQ
ncbi:MAG: hypothetical protein FWD77_08015 [Betaproteobacteria bacterium]|nr:hypothetical protein [Betaproteobacteria bacterium]